MFLHVSVILFTGGWYPSMPCRSRGPHSGGEVEGSGRGGSPGPHMGGIPACTEADPPSTATAAGGTHPTGMHSC